MDNFGLATVSEAGGVPFVALVKDGKALAITALGLGDGTMLDILGRWDTMLPHLATAADGDFSGARSVADYAVHAPFRPGQIFCTGANYKKHVLGLMRDESMHSPQDAAMSDEERLASVAKRLDERTKIGVPFCFVKLPSCVVGPHDDVVLPRNVEKPDWELELAVVIGKRARHVSDIEAMDYVAGFAVANDVTARELVFRRGGPSVGPDWLSGKCFPTFLPFGPYIVPRDCVADWRHLTIKLSVNGKVYQNEATADMLIGVERQVSYLSERVELMPGDLICTGSPYGNGSAFGVVLKPGDVMEGTITGLGTQHNRCVAEA
jgi:2-keto-4-pentenoate hydratase/2-oxohepta-3-ene-1,7-dioic acid hydratase in catechol pathway